MSSNNKKKDQYQYTDPAGFVHYMPENTAIPISEAAKMYNVTETNNETGEQTRFTVKEESPNKFTVREEPEQKPLAETANKPQPKIDYNKEIDRLYKEAFPEEQKPQPKINEIKRLSRLLQDYRFG